MAKVLTKTFKESSAVVGTIVGYNNNLIYSISGTTLYALNLLTGVRQTITANLTYTTHGYGFYEDGALYYYKDASDNTAQKIIQICKYDLNTSTNSLVLQIYTYTASGYTYVVDILKGALYKRGSHYYLLSSQLTTHSSSSKYAYTICMYATSDTITDLSLTVRYGSGYYGQPITTYIRADFESLSTSNISMLAGAVIRSHQSSRSGEFYANTNIIGLNFYRELSTLTDISKYTAPKSTFPDGIYPSNSGNAVIDNIAYIYVDTYRNASDSEDDLTLNKLYTFNLDTALVEESPLTFDKHTGSFVDMYGTDDTMWIFTSDGFYTLTFEEFDLNYNFVDDDGNIIDGVTGALPITAVNLVYEENDVAVTLKYIDGSTETINYTLPAVENKRFYGLNIIADPKSALIVEGDNSVSLSADTTFYPVYQTYRPVGTTFEIDLYQNSAESSRVDKSDYLEQVGTLSGAMRNESSITDLTILIESETVPNFNYVYIPVLNRYYYVTDITTVRYKIWQIQLQVDVLMTYKDGILELTAFIDRNENEHNDNIIDSKRVIEQGYDVEVSTVTNEVFDTAGIGTTTSFVLTGFALKGNSKE